MVSGHPPACVCWDCIKARREKDKGNELSVGQRACGCIVVLVLIAVIVAVVAGLIGSCEGDGDDGDSSAAEAEERRKGFHCLSAWDGNHDGLEALVRQHLNDPGSMETYETRIAPVDADGQHVIIMEFGARNAFGGMVRSEAVGTIDNETCEAALLGIE